MTISRRKEKVKKKARAQKKKARRVSRIQKKKAQKKRGKKSRVSGTTKRKPRQTRKQLERKLVAAQAQIKKLKKLNRSEAAKKGWETRRRKKAEKAEKAIKESETAEGIVFSNLSRDRIEFLQQPHIRRQVQDLYIEKLPDFFVEGEKYVEQFEPGIIRRLIYAQVEGTFDETAHEIADELGYEAHEIYSLWHGYSLPD